MTYSNNNWSMCMHATTGYGVIPIILHHPLTLSPLPSPQPSSSPRAAPRCARSAFHTRARTGGRLQTLVRHARERNPWAPAVIIRKTERERPGDLPLYFWRSILFSNFPLRHHCTSVVRYAAPSPLRTTIPAHFSIRFLILFRCNINQTVRSSIKIDEVIPVLLRWVPL